MRSAACRLCVLARRPWIVSIPGTRSLTRLDEGVGALQLELSAEQQARIDTSLADLQAVGERYAATLEALINR